VSAVIMSLFMIYLTSGQSNTQNVDKNAQVCRERRRNDITNVEDSCR